MFNKILVLSFALFLAGCKTTNRDKGTVIGGVAGAAIGAQFGRGQGQVIAGAAGAILGALIGSKIGESMDEVDRMKMARSTQSALEHNKTNQTTTWRNPDKNHTGSVTPTRTYVNRRGDDCREFTQTVRIGGKEREAYGRACRQSNGSWKIVN